MSKPKKSKKVRPERLKGMELLEFLQRQATLRIDAAIEIRRVLNDYCFESAGTIKQEEFDRDVWELVSEAS